GGTGVVPYRAPWVTVGLGTTTRLFVNRFRRSSCSTCGAAQSARALLNWRCPRFDHRCPMIERMIVSFCLRGSLKNPKTAEPAAYDPFWKTRDRLARTRAV